MRQGTAAWVLAAVVVVWGLSWPVMKVGVEYLSPITFACLRNLLAAVAMFGVSAALGQFRLPHRQDMPLVLSVGAIQIAGYLALVTVALQFVPAGRSAILAFTTPIWVVPGAIFLLRESFGGLKAIGFLLGMVGVGVMFNPGEFDWSDRDQIIGNGLLLLAALLWGVLILQIRMHRWRGSPLSLAPWQMSFGALVLALLIPVLEPQPRLEWSWPLVGVLCYAGFVASAFGVWGSVAATQALPAITVSLALLGSPVVSVMVSALFLGEPITATNLGGLLLISGGLAALAYAQRGEQQPGLHSLSESPAKSSQAAPASSTSRAEK